MEFNFLYTLVFAGIVQGLFLSLFILSSKKNRSRASLYLGLLILITTLGSLQYTLDELNIITWHQFNLLYLPYIFLIAPLLYFFVITYLYPEREAKKREFLLYAPALIFLVITIIYKVVALFSGRTADNDLNQEQLVYFIDIYGDFINISTILITLIYLFIIAKNYTRVINKSRTKVVVHELLWINVLLSLILITIISWFIINYKHMGNEDVDYLPVFIIASFVIYASGYIGIYKLSVLNQRKKIRLFLNENRPKTATIKKPKNEHIAQIENILISNQGYLNPSLTLDSLSEELHLSKSHLSRIINTELKTSFSDYMNSLRISEAKKLLLNPEFSNYTLVSIGLEAGFSSKTTFNTTFKKFTGQTPSQFRKNPFN